VLLVDLGLPDGSGLDLIRTAGARDPAPEVMVISVSPKTHVSREGLDFQPTGGGRVGRRGSLGLAGAVVMALAPAIAVTAAEPVPSFPARHFDDRAGFVSAATAAQLDVRLRAFETRTGHAVYVSIFPRLPSASLEDFTVRTATAWRVGRKGLDDGAILFAFVADHKLRIEVGYGLEGEIPDAIAHRILEEHVAPGLKAGRTDAAFESGVAALLAAAEGRALPTPQAGPEGVQPGESRPPTPAPAPIEIHAPPSRLDPVFDAVTAIASFNLFGLPVGAAFLVALFPFSTSPLLRLFPIRRRLKRGEPLARAWAIESLVLLWIIVSNLGSSRRGSTSSSGGSSSSSSSGGGGRFGGGGASGSW
jgi:uncharacterized protein